MNDDRWVINLDNIECANFRDYYVMVINVYVL